MNLFARFKKHDNRAVALTDNAIQYDRQRKIAENGSPKERLKLARDPGTQPEILYYLAQHDADDTVRAAVANNPSLPLHASAVLAVDRDVDVRMVLAQRLLTLLPDLDPDRQSQLYAFAVQALGALALDEVLAIRRALSHTLKDYAKAPPKIVMQLARDIEREVAEPILRYCVALSDDDLLLLLKEHPAEWAGPAIAGRSPLAATITRAIIAGKHRAAGTVLLGNAGALFDDDVITAIVEQAQHYTEWQQPLATRTTLPMAMVRRLAAFADDAVRELLSAREDFDPETKADIARIFHDRLEAETAAAAEQGYSPDQRQLIEAMGRRDGPRVYAELAQLAGVHQSVVEKIFALKAPKPIVALSRKAGLPMRLALQLQQELGQVPPKDLVYARGGTDYPFTDAELAQQLEFFGLR